ncbi:Kelch-like protein 6 [Branchiostoma belcheri]|nr:Kelch-like protein 6 [Branchiostoma belcheri]
MAAAQRSQPTLDFCGDEHSTTLLQGLQELRSENLLVDVILCVSGKQIPCHRNVLAACSGYFRAMFCHGHRESKEHKVAIQEASASVLQLLVDYAYTSRVTITEDNVLELMKGASFFQVQAVNDACAKFLSDNLSVKNCLEMVNLGGTLNPNLEASALSYLMKEFTALNKMPEFLDLTKDQLIELISSDDLNAPEETVYTAVMKWINHDTRNRKKEMKKLMELIRFPFMDKMFFIEKVESDNTLRNCCPGLMSEALKYQAFPGEVQSPRTRPRRASGLREAVVILAGTETEGIEAPEESPFEGESPIHSDSIMMTHSSEPSSACWVPLTRMKSGTIRGFAVAVLGSSDILVSIGGRVWLYQVNLDNWSDLAPMKKQRINHKLAVVQGKVYALGGIRRLEPLGVTPDVEVYDRSLNKWTKGVPLPEPRFLHAVAVLDGSIYVMGGRDAEESPTCTMYRFSPGDSQWHSERKMPVRADDIAATVLNGCIYVAGLPSKVLRYKPNSWTVLIDSGTGPRCGMTVFGGEIYIYGGRDTDDNKKGTSKVLRLNPKDRSLTQVGTLPRGLFGHGCVTILKG